MERIREAHRLPHVLRRRGPELVGEGIERVAEGDYREAILGVQIREAALERLARLVDLARLPHRAAGVEDEDDVLVDDVLRARQLLGRGEQDEVAAFFALRLEGHEGEAETRRLGPVREQELFVGLSILRFEGEHESLGRLLDLRLLPGCELHVDDVLLVLALDADPRHADRVPGPLQRNAQRDDAAIVRKDLRPRSFDPLRAARGNSIDAHPEPARVALLQHRGLLAQSFRLVVGLFGLLLLLDARGHALPIDPGREVRDGRAFG